MLGHIKDVDMWDEATNRVNVLSFTQLGGVRSNMHSFRMNKCSLNIPQAFHKNIYSLKIYVWYY